MNRAAVWLAIFTLGILAPAQDAQDAETEMSNIKRLKDALFKNYNKHVRPVIHHTNTTKVMMSVNPLYVTDLDEEISALTIDTWILMHWKDDRLSWDQSAYHGLDILRIGDDSIWQPDVALYNSLGSSFDPKKNTHVLLYSDGSILWVPPATLSTFCTPDVANFPNDIQVCNITFGSMTHDGWQIDLHLFDENGIHFEDFSNTNPRWEVLKELSSITRDVQHDTCCDEPYITIVTTITLKRRFPAQLQVIWEPIILVILLTLGIFWFPADSGKKLFFGAFLMLILNLLLVYVASVTKPPHASRKAVSLIRSTMCAVASAILLQIFILNVGRILRPLRPPQPLMQFLSGTAGKFLCTFSSLESKREEDKIYLKEDEDQPDLQSSPKEEWLLVSTALDRIFFLIYIIILAVVINV